MKYKYSKTARERKEEEAKAKRKAEEKVRNAEMKLIKKEEKRVLKEQKSDEKTTFAAAAREFFSKQRNRVAALILAGVLGLSLIIIPILVLTLPKKFNTELPVAEIKLSNKQTLYFELDYHNSPIAVNHFIFLAQEGFFKNVLIFDTQSGYIKFGGFTEFSPYPEHRASTTTIDERAPDHIVSKYSYSIKDDTGADVSRVVEWGTLSTIKYDSNSSSSARTEFQMCANESMNETSKVFNNSDQKWVDIKSIPFGYFYDEQTLSNLVSLKSVAVHGYELSPVWKPPIKEIRVKSVKIHLRQVPDEQNTWTSNWNFYEVMKGNFYNYTYNSSSSTTIR